MFSYKGKTALITGATSGIGLTLSKQLAAKGCNLILVARSLDNLTHVSSQIEQAYHVKSYVIAHDLRLPHSGSIILTQVQALNLHVDILVNNAGISTFGAFDSIEADADQDQIHVNVNSLVDLTHAFIPEMLKQKSGTIINLASIISFVPFPNYSVYAATKAFVLSFSESLHLEYANAGIRIFALCPGPTASNFFERSGLVTPKDSDSVEVVVNRGLSAFEKGKVVYIPNLAYRFQMFMVRISPRSLVYKIASGMSKTKFTKK
jgi:short-subunit dehydrogenase